MRACEFEATDMVKFLVEHGANVNARMESGWTALYTTIKKNNEEAFNHLVTHGANVESKKVLAKHSTMLLWQLSALNNEFGFQLGRINWVNRGETFVWSTSLTTRKS